MKELGSTGNANLVEKSPLLALIEGLGGLSNSIYFQLGKIDAGVNRLGRTEPLDEPPTGEAVDEVNAMSSLVAVELRLKDVLHYAEHIAGQLDNIV
jgi:hypothetical protein